MTLIWIIAFVLGVAATASCSSRAVVAALSASQIARVSPALIGVTVMAIGTDLPEIANSIAAALSGHGDLNVGDGVGSAMTQVTLVLAILCVMVPPINADRRMVGLLGGLTTVALVLDAFLLRDELFARWEGALLILAWIIGLLIVRQLRSDAGEFDDDVAHAIDHRAAALASLRSIAWLGGVAVAATLVVRSFVELTESFGVPELVASAIVLSLGTSLPELFVDLTAIRQGATSLAIGDLFGSSLVDATMALGSGPAIRATVVSSDSVMTCLIAAAGVAAATLIVVRRREHRYTSGGLLFGAYLAATAGLVIWAS